MFDFQSDRIDNGLIVLTHGINSHGTASWLQDLAEAIEGAITHYAGSSSLPNIALYDWEEDAVTDLSIFKALASPYLEDLDTNLTDVTANGIYHGAHLADWIHAQTIAGLIDPNAPIHLIGHSAGGFVMGQTAILLNRAGIWVDRVTMLDTPRPWPDHLRELPENGTVVERLITSIYGAQNYWWGVPLSNGDTYKIQFYPFFLFAVNNVGMGETGHGLAYRRYQYTATFGHDDFLTTEGVSFGNSPFVSGTLNPNRQDGAQIKSSVFLPHKPESLSAVEREQPISTFTSYGTTELSGTEHTLVEVPDTDSGIYADIEVPVGAFAVSFSYQFETGDEEDRLVVNAGDNAVPVIVPNLPLFRTQEFQGWLEVAALGGTTVTLDFRLEGTGEANARVRISAIEFQTSDDVDQDSIPNADEITLGTNPLSRDTDKDGLTDYDEINVHFSDPTTADSDFDGVDDGVEVSAGFDPNSAASRFEISGISVDSDGIVRVTLPCSPGKTYRLRGADIPYGSTNRTIAAGIQSDTGSAIIDDEGRLETDRHFFYWVEVETAE